jgi:polyribonucleotide nucleotidyltransferase
MVRMVIMVLVTAVAASEAKEGLDYFPLQVEYREKTSAAGKFPGGYIKREGRPTEKEILSSRLCDRPIRPLFPPSFTNETQVVAMVMSYDGENDPDVLAACGASAALQSQIFHLWSMGELDWKNYGELIVNPTHEQIKLGDIELVVAWTADSIMMVSESKVVNKLLDVLKFISGIKKLLMFKINYVQKQENKMDFAEKLLMQSKRCLWKQKQSIKRCLFNSAREDSNKKNFLNHKSTCRKIS